MPYIDHILVDFASLEHFRSWYLWSMSRAIFRCRYGASVSVMMGSIWHLSQMTKEYLCTHTRRRSMSEPTLSTPFGLYSPSNNFSWSEWLRIVYIESSLTWCSASLTPDNKLHDFMMLVCTGTNSMKAIGNGINVSLRTPLSLTLLGFKYLICKGLDTIMSNVNAKRSIYIADHETDEYWPPHLCKGETYRDVQNLKLYRSSNTDLFSKRTAIGAEEDLADWEWYNMEYISHSLSYRYKLLTITSGWHGQSTLIIEPVLMYKDDNSWLKALNELPFLWWQVQMSNSLAILNLCILACLLCSGDFSFLLFWIFPPFISYASSSTLQNQASWRQMSKFKVAGDRCQNLKLTLKPVNKLARNYYIG